MTTDPRQVWAFDEREELTLESAVYQAVGGASMCWEHVDRAGVFDDTRAAEVGDALLAKLRGGLLPAPEPDLIKEFGPQFGSFLTRERAPETESERAERHALNRPLTGAFNQLAAESQPDPLVLSLPEVPEGTVALTGVESGQRYEADESGEDPRWFDDGEQGWYLWQVLGQEPHGVRVELAPPRKPRTAAEIWASLGADERTELAAARPSENDDLFVALDREAGL